MSRRKAVLTVVGTLALLSSVLAGARAIRAGTAHYTGTIAFFRSLHGRAYDYKTGPNLYVIHADGSGLRRLTPPRTPVSAYAWAPDARLIAYTDARTLSLWLVRPDGKGRRLLLPGSKLSTVGLSWSPDGKDIAIVSVGPGQTLLTANESKAALYVVPVSGGAPRLLRRHVGWDIAWSPRGDDIGYDGRPGIWVIRPDGAGRRQVSPVGGPNWSPDGEQLAFGVRFPRRSGVALPRSPRALGDLYFSTFAVVNADGTGFHVVTTHAYNEYGVRWSPSGRQILYGRAHRQGIYVIDSDGRNNRRVTRDSPPQAGWGALAWSPSGGAIVYTTGGTDDTNLYVIGIDGRGKRLLTSTSDVDTNPSWVAR